MENIIVACVGALFINLLNLVELRTVPKEQRPDFKDWVYWLPYVVNPLLGGFLVYVYQSADHSFDTIIALNVGASAPLILRALTRAIPPGFEPRDTDTANVNATPNQVPAGNQNI